MTLLPQLVVTGIAFGALYGLAGMGFNLIFSTTRMFDVSIGATYLVVSYLFFSLVHGLHLALAIAIPLGLLAGAACGLLFYGSVFTWIERRSRGGFFTYFVASFGILTVVQNILSMIYGSGRVFIGQELLKPIGPGFLAVPRVDFLALAVAIACYVGLDALLRRTPLGVRFRALAENQALLTIIGLAGRTWYALAFALGSVLIAAAALVSIGLQGISPSDGFNLANLAIAAMLVGGLGSYRGAMLGGVVLGLAQSIAVYWLPGAWNSAIAFGALLVVLLVRPTGLLGRAR
jgi:branched-subunit amino acid ABC-type transport system permease component